MTKSIGVLAAAAVALVGVATPAEAATSKFRAQATDVTVVDLVGDTPDELAEVAAYCPDGWVERAGLLVKTVAHVQVQSEVYTGPLEVTDMHCSVPRPPLATWIDRTRKVTPIELEAGSMTLTAPSGDELYITYRLPGVIKGDLFGLNIHTFNGPYTITGGTGAFEGASGRGHIGGAVEATATGYTGAWDANGMLSVPD